MSSSDETASEVIEAIPQEWVENQLQAMADGWKLEDETEPGGALAGRIASDVVIACQRIGRDIERAGAKVRKFLIRDNVRAKFAVSVLISVEVNGKRVANYVDAVVVSSFVNHVENWLADQGVTLGVDHV